ncbi:uncharacterized protein AAG666_017850 isoform 4-T13 [Megaptera novaeangliae]
MGGGGGAVYLDCHVTSPAPLPRSCVNKSPASLPGLPRPCHGPTATALLTDQVAGHCLCPHRLWAPLRLTVRALDLQQQYHLGTGWKCNFSGPISDLLNQKLCVLCCHEPFRPVPTHAGRPQQLPPSPGFTVTSSHPNYQARPRDATQTPVSRRVCDGKECGPLSMRGSASIASPASWEPQVSGREPLPSTRAPRPPLTPFQSKARSTPF